MRMNRCRQRPETLDERRSRSVHEFITNAVNPALPNRAHLLPPPIVDDFLQGHSVAGSAPGRNQDIWISSQNCLRRGL